MKKIFFTIFLFAGLFIISQSAKAISLSPPKIEFTMEPGQTARYNLTLFNETAEDVYLNGKIEVFTPKGETGEANIAPAAPSYQAVNWASLPLNSFYLKAGEKTEAPLIINTPKTADAGGYYLAAMWEASSGPRKNQDQINIGSRVGVLIFIKVGGETKEELSIEEFGLVQNKSFFNHLPAEFFSRLKNSGNVHVKPQGRVIIKNMFGRAVASLPLNESDFFVLPQSIRKLDTTWQRHFQNGALAVIGKVWPGLGEELKQIAFGRFGAQLLVEYGQENKRLYSSEVYFWVAPWRLLVLTLVLVLILIILKIVKKKLEKRRYV